MQPTILLMDRHVSHLCLETIQLLLQNDIHPLYFPAHTSHFIQPLDNLGNAVIKSGIAKKRYELTMQLRSAGEKFKDITYEVADEAIGAALSDFGCFVLWPLFQEMVSNRWVSAYTWDLLAGKLLNRTSQTGGWLNSDK